MNTEDDIDISHTTLTKSDQLNADDLIQGPITVRIEDAACTDGGEQPVTIWISGGFKPWKPCKTMRRVLIHAWGSKARAYIGRWIVLARDPDVKWAGEKVGGIRIKAMSDIPSTITIALNETKKSKAKHTIEVYRPTEQSRTSTPSMNVEAFDEAVRGHGVKAIDLAEWRASQDPPKKPTADLTDAERGMLAAALAPGARVRQALDAWIAARSPAPEGDTP